VPRGAAPVALENLVPYYRGARYSLLALRLRHPDLPSQVVADMERRVAMLDRYSESAVATFRKRRQRAGPPPDGR
jgi:hypothetical protein